MMNRSASRAWLARRRRAAAAGLAGPERRHRQRQAGAEGARRPLISQATQAAGQQRSPELETRARDEVVLREIFVQEAEKRGLAATPDYKAQMELVRQTRPDPRAVRGLREEEPGHRRRGAGRVRQVQGPVAGTEYRARHILVEKEDDAKKLIAQIKGGAKFEDLAKKNSKDPGSGENGGDLDFAKPDTYVPEFGKAMTKLKKGEMTDAPVKTQFGYHIIRLEDTREAQFPAFDEVKPQIEQRLAQQKLQQFQEDLRKTAKTDYKFGRRRSDDSDGRLSAGLAASAVEPAGLDVQLAVAARRDGRVVRHQHQRRAGLAVELEHQLHHLSRRWRSPGCRWARRPAAPPAARRRPAPAPRAAARRPTAPSGSGRAARPGRRGPASRWRAARASLRPSSSSGSITFSSAVRLASSWKLWNTKPSFRARSAARASSSSANRSVPASRTVPRVGVSRPAMIDSSVLLPEPEAPTMAADSRARSVKSMSWRMVSVPVESATCLVTVLTAMIGSDMRSSGFVASTRRALAAAL